MTAHELARALLEGPDHLVELHVGDPKDTYCGDIGDVLIREGTIDVEAARARGDDETQPGPCVVLRSWQSSEVGDDEDDN